MRKCIFRKHPANPILSPADFPAEVMYVFNPGAIKFEGQYLLLADAALGSTSIVLWLARSDDGVHFIPDPAPVDWPAAQPHEHCIYDPRITRFGGEYIIMYASHQTGCDNPRIGVVSTTDFKTFRRIEQRYDACPNRNGVLFPEKIGGRYFRLDRPMPKGELDNADMCISCSDDLSDWGDTKVLMKPRLDSWDSHKIGGAAVPLRTPEGWLVIYHGVDGSSCNNYIYRLGTMLLDLKDPSKIIARGAYPVLWPEHSYEFFGRTPNVVFSCNAILEADNSVRIYYGAADSCVGMAEAGLDDLIASCYESDVIKRRFFSSCKPPP